MTRVLGLDGYPGGWVVAAIDDGRITDITTAATLDDLLPAPGVACIAVDMPLAFPVEGQGRAAELEARTLLGRRASSLFLTPPREVLECEPHAEAVRCARELDVPAPSAQAYSLRRKILEAAPVAEADERFIEVHPELSFQALNRGPLAAGKRTWNGLNERRALLRESGVEVPDRIHASAPADDVLDAAVAAFTAWRHLHEATIALPRETPPETPRHRIWLPA